MQLRAWTAQRSNLTFESGHELDMTQAVLEASFLKNDASDSVSQVWLCQFFEMQCVTCNFWELEQIERPLGERW